jgi:hypothetical protein
MDITADQARKSNLGDRLIDQEVKKILKYIQGCILDAGKKGETFVIVTVPVNFDIPNITNKEAQTVIYYKIIEECLDKGFRVKISMDVSVVTYCIYWYAENSDRDLGKMREVIAKHAVKNSSQKDTTKS